MIDFIEGEIVAKEAQKLVLRTGGVGFGLKVSAQTLSGLPHPGNSALVYTNMQIKEEDISLYGFSTREERAFFELLIQVSGVGPKLALAILSAYPVPALKKALVMGDLATLGTISGIGKKTAQRMVLELKDKLSREMIPGDIGDGVEPGFLSGEDSELSQAIEALEALGYGRGEIMKVFTGTDLGQMKIDDMIRLGLRQLAR
ncbi:MAG: Holliday junction branch migration protein RuvA [Clostridiales bacterium]|nr:Holliday junction branch migration protein RuvA [Clostridiales bacterium]